MKKIYCTPTTKFINCNFHSNIMENPVQATSSDFSDIDTPASDVPLF